MRYSHLVVVMLASLVVLGVLAIGPADASVQPQIGNLHQAQQQEPTPKPTPMPTVCIQ